MHSAFSSHVRHLSVAVLAVALMVPLATEVLISYATGSVLSGWSGYVSFFALLIALASSWNSFANPFIYLLPVFAYLLPGLWLLGDERDFFRYKEGWVLFLSLLFIWIGFSFKKPSESEYRVGQESISAMNWLALVASSAVMIILLRVAVLYGGLFGKAIALLLKDIVLLVLFGGLMALAHRSRLYFHFGFLLYVCCLVISGYLSTDVSRFGYLRAGLVYLVAVSVWAKGGLKPISVTSLMFGVVLLIFVIFSAGDDALLKFGGDVLIPSYVHDVIKWMDESASLKNQPLMPLFNAGPVLVPDHLWVFEKPKFFNPSAWYLENILNIDPATYPWGLGLGGVGAAYLYGGVVAVAILYFIYGIFIRSVLSRVHTGFDFGIYLYFVTLLPFAAYRMDETFMFGVAFVVVPATYLLLARKRTAF